MSFDYFHKHPDTVDPVHLAEVIALEIIKREEASARDKGIAGL